MSYDALNDLPAGVLWFAKDAKFFDVNKAACKLFGYTKEEFLTLSVFDVNPNMHPEIWEKHWEAKQNDPSSFEGIHRRKNGEVFPVDITDNFVTYEGQVYSCAIVTDITERRKANKQAELADFTIKMAKDAIFWLCPKGLIKRVNDAAIERYGYTREEFHEMNILNITRDMGEEKFREIWETLQEKKHIEIEAHHYCKSGKKIEVEISSHFIRFGSMDYTCSMVRDITERKKKEAELQDALLKIKEFKKTLEAENNYLQEEINVQNNFGEIISTSKKFQKVLNQVEQVAETSSTVLITGESGTGKELIARAIHQLSRRNIKPMIKINCAALPANLIESELFGHEKGAFTGALDKKIGKFELANGGTLFLDEIGEMPIELQSKILRALQEGEIERVGSNKVLKVDVRIIAATNRNLPKEVGEGNFREDLYYRLNVFPIHSLPLRDRKEDIPLLVQFFCEKIGNKLGRKITNIPQKVITNLMEYNFPGNIRELENLIERGIIMSRGNKLSLGSWCNLKNKRVLPQKIISLEEVQKNHIVETLKHTAWKVSGKGGAAELLNIRPTTLFSKIEKLGIKRSNNAF